MLEDFSTFLGLKIVSFKLCPWFLYIHKVRVGEYAKEFTSERELENFKICHSFAHLVYDPKTKELSPFDVYFKKVGQQLLLQWPKWKKHHLFAKSGVPLWKFFGWLMGKKQAMGHIYEDMNRAKETIKYAFNNNVEKYQQFFWYHWQEIGCWTASSFADCCVLSQSLFILHKSWD